MHSAKSSVRFLSFAVALSLLSVGSASGAGVNLEAFFSGLKEVPPNASPAFGTAAAFINETTDVFSIALGAGTYNNLLSGALTVTLNDAAPGNNGPVIGTLTLDTPGATSGTFHGTVNVTPAQVADIESGLTYLNITNAIFPNGEIRGQLEVIPEPSAMILAGLGGFAWLAVRSRGLRKAA